MHHPKITNVATPTVSTDAANKQYVDSVAQGLDVKDSVYAATTTDLSNVFTTVTQSNTSVTISGTSYTTTN